MYGRGTTVFFILIPSPTVAAVATKVSSKNRIDSGTPLKMSFEMGFSVSSVRGKLIFKSFPVSASAKAASAELKISVYGLLDNIWQTAKTSLFQAIKAMSYNWFCPELFPYNAKSTTRSPYPAVPVNVNWDNCGPMKSENPTILSW